MILYLQKMGSVAEMAGGKLFVAVRTGRGVVALPSILHPDRGLTWGCATALKHRQLHQCPPASCSVRSPPHRLRLLTRYHRSSLHKVKHSWTEVTTSPLPLEHPPFLQEGFSQGALRRGRKGTHCSGAFQQR